MSMNNCGMCKHGISSFPHSVVQQTDAAVAAPYDVIKRRDDAMLCGLCQMCVETLYVNLCMHWIFSHTFTKTFQIFLYALSA